MTKKKEEAPRSAVKGITLKELNVKTSVCGVMNCMESAEWRVTFQVGREGYVSRVCKYHKRHLELNGAVMESEDGEGDPDGTTTDAPQVF